MRAEAAPVPPTKEENPMFLPTQAGTNTAPIEPATPEQFMRELASGDLSGWTVEESVGNVADVIPGWKPPPTNQK